jgi:DNA-binding LytR/AlgR family response regulator
MCLVQFFLGGGTQMLNIAICDDSVYCIEMLEKLLDAYPGKKSIQYDVFDNPIHLLDYQKANNVLYKLYILDIEMDDMNGISLAKSIRKFDQKSLIVFLTSHNQYVFDVFNVVVFDFLLKPITQEKLYATLNKVFEYLNITKKVFVFSYRKNLFSLYCDEILYFEKLRRSLIIHTEEKTYICNMTISQIWEQLDQSYFAHIHTSYIVNLKYIREIVQKEIILTNNTQLHIAKSYRQSIKEKHLQFIKKEIYGLYI